MIIDFSVLVTAFFLGLFSSAHCLGMCGGIMGALSMAIPAQQSQRKWLILGAYNIGRLFSYGVMGVLVGFFAHQLTASGGAMVLRWIAGLLLIAMGLYLANWWRGLTYLESAGRYLWAYISPLGKRLMPVTTIPKGLLLGALWGWLPCGLVYSALAFSMAQGHWGLSGLTMLVFGAGTLPSLLLAGAAAQQFNQLLQRRQLRWLVAVLVILFGVWTLWGASSHHHNHGSAHENHENHENHEHAVPEATGAPASQEHHNHHQHVLQQSASSAAETAEPHSHH